MSNSTAARKNNDYLYIAEENTLKEDNLLKLIDSLKDYAIILLDENGYIQSWNLGAERIKGYVEREIVGKHISVFYTEKDQREEKPKMLIQKAKVYGTANYEGWRVKKDGTMFWGSITISSIHNDDGNLIGFGKVTRDLTIEKKTEEIRTKYLQELERKNKELEQFIYIASHDLQEPLRTVLSFSELIHKKYDNKLDNNAKLYFDFITKSTKRMQDLIKGLLDYGRIGNDKELVWVNGNQIIMEVIEDMGLSISESKVNISVATLPNFKGHRTEIRLLFQNLLANAIKFRKEGCPLKINVSAKTEKDGWLFSIEDNGIGIEEQNKEKIFAIFKKLHNRNEYDGTGIGLSHCKKIVELHQGKIWVESEIDKGSTFYFTIPKL